MKKNKKILIPSYATDFRCIGGACEDSCCIGWDIDVDKKTFKKYASTKNREMGEKFAEHIYINGDSYSREVDYARIEIKDTRWCPFLDEEKLCEIQRKLGEDHLSNVCYSFPRAYNVFNDVYELSLYMSCPEAVRKLLSSTDPITFTEHPMADVKHIVNNSIDTEKRRWKKTPLKRLPELRTLSLEIIQNRTLPMHLRLEELGRRLDVPGREGTLTDKYAFRSDFFGYVIESLGVIDKTDSPVFADYTKAVLEMRKKGNEPYRDAVKMIIGPFLETNAHLFEHYLVNFIFQNNFPYSENFDVSDGFVMLIMRFGLLQYYLTGLAVRKGSISTGDVASMIQVHTKIISHHKSFLYNMLQEIKRRKLDNRDFAALITD